MFAEVGEVGEAEFVFELGDLWKGPPSVGPGAVGDDHDVGGSHPFSGAEGPVEAPFLVVALEEDDVGAGGHFADEVGFVVAEASVDGVGLDDDGPGGEGGKEFEEALVAVAAALWIVVLVEAVFVLNVDGVGGEAFDFLDDGLPPVWLGHVDDGTNAVASAIGVGDDEDLTFGVAFLDELARFLGECSDATEARGVAAYDDDG